MQRLAHLRGPQRVLGVAVECVLRFHFQMKVILLELAHGYLHALVLFEAVGGVHVLKNVPDGLSVESSSAPRRRAGARHPAHFLSAGLMSLSLLLEELLVFRHQLHDLLVEILSIVTSFRQGVVQLTDHLLEMLALELTLLPLRLQRLWQRQGEPLSVPAIRAPTSRFMEKPRIARLNAWSAERRPGLSGLDRGQLAHYTCGQPDIPRLSALAAQGHARRTFSAPASKPLRAGPT
mmetsp:Transcript_96820/g.273617  ORF Transcript_96820/g.273617 Transcript_96820/m.273617 type:complete len:235 (+) Transcript_96820:651-1355(+)